MISSLLTERSVALNVLRCLSLALAVAASASAQESMPFWGDETPATNRVSASVQTVALGDGFSSLLYGEISASLPRFSSKKRVFHLIVR